MPLLCSRIIFVHRADRVILLKIRWSTDAFNALFLLRRELSPRTFIPSERVLARKARVFFRDSQVYKSIIRLHSAQQWPERIVLGTNQPTPAPPQTVLDAMPPNPRDALAQLQSLPSKQPDASSQREPTMVGWPQFRLLQERSSRPGNRTPQNGLLSFRVRKLNASTLQLPRPRFCQSLQILMKERATAQDPFVVSRLASRYSLQKCPVEALVAHHTWRINDNRQVSLERSAASAATNQA
jgi:hypothetical protein